LPSPVGEGGFGWKCLHCPVKDGRGPPSPVPRPPHSLPSMSGNRQQGAPFAFPCGEGGFGLGASQGKATQKCSQIHRKCASGILETRPNACIVQSKTKEVPVAGRAETGCAPSSALKKMKVNAGKKKFNFFPALCMKKSGEIQLYSKAIVFQ